MKNEWVAVLVLAVIGLYPTGAFGSIALSVSLTLDYPVARQRIHPGSLLSGATACYATVQSCPLPLDAATWAQASAKEMSQAIGIRTTNGEGGSTATPVLPPVGDLAPGTPVRTLLCGFGLLVLACAVQVRERRRKGLTF